MRKVIFNTQLSGDKQTYEKGSVHTFRDDDAARLVEKGHASYTELSEDEIKAYKKAEKESEKSFKELLTAKNTLESELKEAKETIAHLEAEKTLKEEALKEIELLKRELAELKGE
jgi:hypothetical protein